MHATPTESLRFSRASEEVPLGLAMGIIFAHCWPGYLAPLYRAEWSRDDEVASVPNEWEAYGDGDLCSYTLLVPVTLSP